MADIDISSAEYRTALKRAAVDVKRLEGGNLILRSPYPFNASEENIGDWLRKWATEDPTRLFLAKRFVKNPGKFREEAVWEEITYGDALLQVRAIGQHLATRDLNAEQPVLLISKNGIQNALMQLAAMDVGIPAVHISPSLALTEAQFDGFKNVFEQTTPGLVFAAEGKPFERALAYAAEMGAEIVLGEDPIEGLPSTDFTKLTKAWRKGAGKKARSQITPETVAKIQFSGTKPGEMTGIVTSQMTMSANQEALAELVPALSARPPIVVDDAPWHAANSGSLVFNAVLRNGGTLYIDKFGPDAKRKDDLETPSPSIHFTEMIPLTALVTLLEEDVLLRKAFFRNLDLIWIVNGTLTPGARERLQTIAIEQTGAKIPILASFTGMGTAAINTALYFDSEEPSNIGLPIPGTQIKLVKVGADEDQTFGINVKADGLNPAIWRNGELLEAETDEDGFYAVYETVSLIDEMRPFKGLRRVSRVTEA